MRQKLLLYLSSILFLFLNTFYLNFLIPNSHALSEGWECNIAAISPTITGDSKKIDSLTIDPNVDLFEQYSVFIDSQGGDGRVQRIKQDVVVENNQIKITSPFDKDGNTSDGSNEEVFVEGSDVIFWVTPKTTIREFNSSDGFREIDAFAKCKTSFTVGEGVGVDIDNSKCSITASGEGAGEMVHLKINFNDRYISDFSSFIVEVFRPPYEEDNDDYLIYPDGNGGKKYWGPYNGINDQNKSMDIALANYPPNQTAVAFDSGTYKARVTSDVPGRYTSFCNNLFTITDSGVNNPDNAYDAGLGLFACTPDDPNFPEVYTCQTAIGPISTNAEGFIKTILALILGLAGGILLIVIILNGYKFMISQGDPEKIKDAREGIIAAIMGIFLIIFSLTILSIVTSNILDIPGFR